MSDAPRKNNPASPTPEQARQIDQLCDRFEAAWRAGKRPRLEAYLGDLAEPKRSALLRELLALELAYRSRAGESPQRGEYLQRFPKMTSVVQAVFAEVLPSEDATVPPAAPADTQSGPPMPEGLEFLAPPKGPGELGRLGPYRILKVLGQGGMGMVFLAEDVNLRRRVALKVMLPGMGLNSEAREHFLREARAVAAVEHDHIVSIYQVGQDRNVLFLAMQLLKGETLDQRLRCATPLPLDEVLRISREVAAGLAAAHDRGLIHRDVKPANLWLEEVAGRVKILDFGLARNRGDKNVLTTPGAIIGTPGYMAPEQATGKGTDARSDLFSLGCVMYHAVTGRPPFQGDDMLSTLAAVATETPPPPHKLNRQLPRGLSTLIVQMLSKDPAARPVSAQYVGVALDSLARTGLLPGQKRSGGRVVMVLLLLLVLGCLSAAAYFFGATFFSPPATTTETEQATVPTPTAPEATFPRTTPTVRTPPTTAMEIRPPTLLPGGTSLFDGKTLNLWKTHPKQPGDWTVVDGVLIGKGKKSYLFTDRADYENFHFLVEVSLDANANSGQFFRCKYELPTATSDPLGYEAQLYEGSDKGGYYTGSLYNFARVGDGLSQKEKDKIPKEKIKSGQWFTQEVIARGDRIVIKVNGVTTVDLMDPAKTYVRGHFALQQMGSGEVRFRRIEVKELAPSKP